MEFGVPGAPEEWSSILSGSHGLHNQELRRRILLQRPGHEAIPPLHCANQ